MLSIMQWILSIDTTTGLIFLLCLGITLYILSGNRLRNFPPGPKNIPILGYLPIVFGKNIEHVYMDLKKKYGDVVYFRLGERQIVTLNSYDTIKEALLLNPEVSITRPEDFGAALKPKINYTGHILVDNGKVWVEHRRFLMRTLRDLGMGKTSLESEIKEEASVLVGEISKNSGQPFDIHPLLRKAAANIVIALLHGFRFDYNDPQFHALLHIVFAAQKRTAPLKLSDSFYYIRYVLNRFMSGMAEVNQVKKVLNQFVDKKLTEHTNLDEEANDYINLYLRQQKEELAKGNSNTTFTHTRLRNNVFILNQAGITTVTSTMNWVIKMIIRNPDIQQRLHKEIDSVIGFDRVPSISDKPNMLYTEAFLMELQRYADVTPVGLQHSTTRGTKIAGYEIPKGTSIMTMLCMVHNDPKIWGDPENFRPDRFIGEDGQIIKSEYLISFGKGKRNCPGEQLALMEVFVYTTLLLQNFQFSPATIADTEIEDDTFGVSRDLSSFQVIIQPRNPALIQD